ncbi:Granule-bound starch synthase 1, chloroplastic/amyloplastic [Vitis vinifera]|uniref:Granule-bound starch synthase 1, chloroplastic/amyloplastic n=1 Tax=Vitis vinifera TaxID=29760 RepID=A0A438DQM7_VITVI|nr:Granule-bound starch synthase 1, chloroplastic/amyloplastic [Vitis vinifera]
MVTTSGNPKLGTDPEGNAMPFNHSKRRKGKKKETIQPFSNCHVECIVTEIKHYKWQLVVWNKKSVMATVTASNFLPRSSNGNCGATCRIEKKATLTKLRPKIQILAHNGLRALNSVDELHQRTTIKVTRKGSRKGFKNENPRPWGGIICGCGMSLIFVGTEVGPWSKTGGLGDVLGGLPPAMSANGHRVMTVSPRFDQYKDAWDTGVTVQLNVGDRFEKVRFFHCYKRGVDRVFVDHPWFLEKVWGKTGSKLYGPLAGEDFQDNQLRFSLLCQAALEAPRILNLKSSKYFSGPYGEDVVFIANDWHTAPLACYLKTMYRLKGRYGNAKVVFCIHNIAYQGRFAFADFSLLNLPDEFKSSFDFTDGYEKPVKGRKINWMKAGILEADKVLTVSPYYAKELVSGEGGKASSEGSPTSRSWVASDRNIPVIGFIGRLEEQKGSDILVAAIPQFVTANVQIIVLGTGKKPMEKQLEQLEKKYPDNARGVAKFNVPLAHMIIAGADFLLVPSRFEPCGLIQLHAMRYGTVPIVASTGGLVDTVKEGFTGFQMGSFSVECDAVDPADATAVATSVKRALATYGTPALTEMVQNCMAQDLSWKKWEEVLLSLGVPGSEPGIDGEEIAPLSKENVATP